MCVWFLCWRWKQSDECLYGLELWKGGEPNKNGASVAWLPIDCSVVHLSSSISEINHQTWEKKRRAIPWFGHDSPSALKERLWNPMTEVISISIATISNEKNWRICTVYIRLKEQTATMFELNIQNILNIQSCTKKVNLTVIFETSWNWLKYLHNSLFHCE